MRGRRRTRNPPAGSGGSIPAGAGPTRRRARASCACTEHPRGCGADLGPGLTRFRQPGASPRVRGRPTGGPARTPGRGSIPAGAGPTRPGARRRLTAQEHPRGCGADIRQLSIPGGTRGASPRVRGRPWSPRSSAAAERSIPAGAGPTSSGPHREVRAAEHPRGCGADDSSNDDSSEVTGASPRVRGRLQEVAEALGVVGSIPAGAGPTAWRPRP